MSGSKRVWQVLATMLAVVGLIAAGCGDDDDDGGQGGRRRGRRGQHLGAAARHRVVRPVGAGRPPVLHRGVRGGRPVGGRRLHIVNAEGDASTQQSQAEQAIADGASVIVLTSLDTGSGATIIDQAKDAGVEVVEYDRFNTGGSGGDAYVSFDNVQVGATMAEAMEPAIDALGLAPPAGRDAQRRRGGQQLVPVQAGLRRDRRGRVDAGDWELVADQFVPEWDNPEAQTLMEQILVDAGNDVDAVFAANDGLANSAINAIEAAGVGPVPVSGQDATAAGIQNVLLGKQTVSVYKPIQDEAGVAAAIALALRSGDDIEEPPLVRVAAGLGRLRRRVIGIDAETASPPTPPRATASCPTSPSCRSASPSTTWPTR